MEVRHNPTTHHNPTNQKQLGVLSVGRSVVGWCQKMARKMNKLAQA
jgi:hypothetical protein